MRNTRKRYRLDVLNLNQMEVKFIGIEKVRTWNGQQKKIYSAIC